MKGCKFGEGGEIVKGGMIRGCQRYLCKRCGKNQVSGDRRVKYSNKEKYMAVTFYGN